LSDIAEPAAVAATQSAPFLTALLAAKAVGAIVFFDLFPGGLRAEHFARQTGNRFEGHTAPPYWTVVPSKKIAFI
jgi:hypothetical protein